jgi:hypothetical protein
MKAGALYMDNDYDLSPRTTLENDPYLEDDDLAFVIPEEPVVDTPFKNKHVSISPSCLRISSGFFAFVAPFIGAFTDYDVTPYTDYYVRPYDREHLPRKTYKPHNQIKAEYFASHSSGLVILDELEFFDMLPPRLVLAMDITSYFPDRRPALFYRYLTSPEPPVLLEEQKKYLQHRALLAAIMQERAEAQAQKEERRRLERNAKARERRRAKKEAEKNSPPPKKPEPPKTTLQLAEENGWEMTPELRQQIIRESFKRRSKQPPWNKMG